MQDTEETATSQTVKAENGSIVTHVTQIGIQKIDSHGVLLRVPFQAPLLSENFVERPEVKDEVKSHFLNSNNPKGILAITALQGLGGIGKTTLATVLAHDEEIKNRFSDGTLWVTLGQEPDKLSLLNSWIKALGDYQFNPTTEEAASSHLRTLLSEKSTLLVIDDAWEPEDVKSFLVGGSYCQTLITTRRTYIAEDLGAKSYPLDVMTKEQSLNLFEKILEKRLDERERGDALKVAEDISYLPLALTLAAKRRKRGVSWVKLHEALEEEISRLSALEDPRNLRKGVKKLEACLNLSLKALRLYDEEAWKAFIWFGVLPEDVEINARMTSTLWEMSEDEAGEILEILWEESLISRSSTIKFGDYEIVCYQMHDLLHDIASQYIIFPTTPRTENSLSGLGLKVKEAHASLLERYHSQSKRKLWHTIQDDGYIHNHLIWHMEKAGWFSEIHTLLSEETENKKNGWYEARESLGQTAEFIEDLIRARKIVEKTSEIELKNIGAAPKIGLEIQYLLMTASINSLATGMPAELLIELVKKGLWTPIQGITYSRQESNLKKRIEKLVKLIPLLPESMRNEVLKETLETAEKINQTKVTDEILVNIASQLPQSMYTEALELVKKIQSGSFKVKALISILPQIPLPMKIDLIKEILEISLKITDDIERKEALESLNFELPQSMRNLVRGELVKIESNLIEANFQGKDEKEVLGFEEEVLDPEEEALDYEEEPDNLQELKIKKFIEASQSQLNYGNLNAREALNLASQISSERNKAEFLAKIFIDSSIPKENIKVELIEETLSAIKTIKNDVVKSDILVTVVPKLPSSMLKEALDIAENIKDRKPKEQAISSIISQYPKSMLTEALNVAREIQQEEYRSEALAAIVPRLHSSKLREALDIAMQIQDELEQSKALSSIFTKMPESMSKEALEYSKEYQNKNHQIKIIASLVPKLPVSIQDEIINEALNTTFQVQNEYERAKTLCSLLPYLSNEMKNKILEEILDVIHNTQNEYIREEIIITIIPQISLKMLEEVLDIVKLFNYEYPKANVLVSLIPQLPLPMIVEVLNITKQINFYYPRSKVLISAIPYLPSSMKKDVFTEALDSARKIEIHKYRAKILVEIIPYLPRSKKNEILKEILFSIQNVNGTENKIESWILMLPYIRNSKKENFTKYILNKVMLISDECQREQNLVSLVPYLTDLSNEFLYQIWRDITKIMAGHTRKNLLINISALVPIISKLGGEEAIIGTFQSIKNVTHWWS